MDKTSSSRGFASAIKDWADKPLDLNKFLIKKPNSTFFMRMKGEAMENFGIYNNDILIVDRTLPPLNKKIVVSIVDNDFIVRKMLKIDNKIYLTSGNSNFKPIIGEFESTISYWGRVTFSIHNIYEQ